MPNETHRASRGRTRIQAARYFGHVNEERYERLRDLPRLLPLLAEDIAGTTLADDRRLLALLKRALRAERLRSRQRHWTYDPARHAALVRATRIENAALRRRCEQLRVHHQA